MADYCLTAQQLKGNSCYPENVQELINLMANYLSFRVDGFPQAYTLGSSIPGLSSTDRPWFQTQANLPNLGLPKAIRAYSNGQWKEFSQFIQGDIILVPINYPVVSPWGNPGETYSFGGLGFPDYTAPANLIAPADYKYKVYVGYYS